MTKFPLTSETPDYIDQYFISNDGELRAQVRTDLLILKQTIDSLRVDEVIKSFGEEYSHWPSQRSIFANNKTIGENDLFDLKR